MTSIFSDGALHPGRDANDSAWLVLRDAHDWSGAAMIGVVLEPALPALILAPGPVAGDPPLAGELVGPDGTAYRSDPAGDRVWWRRACDADWSVLIGGRGTETGRLRRPLGLSLDTRRGLLAIADADNHRVQIVRADGGEVVTVLGCLDAWGRGVPPAGGAARDHAMAEPVAVAFEGSWLVVADRAGGAVHVYDDRFRHAAVIAPTPPGAPSGFVPAPLAVALAGCVIWVVDQGWSTAVAYGLDGEPIDGAGPPSAALGAWAARATFAARGEVVHGPIDGQIEGLAWHRVLVDAVAPAGTAIEVQTFAADDPSPPAVIPWAPARPVAIPLAGVEPGDGEVGRPVLSDHGRWLRKRGEPYRRASRPLVRLDGTGPSSVAGFTAPWAAARRLRALDEIVLAVAGGATTPVLPIASIADRAIQVVVHAGGDLQDYGPTCTLTLTERDGAAPNGGPRRIAEVGPGEALRLGTAGDDGTIYDVIATHAVAALLRDGDVIRVEDPVGPAEATIVVHTVDRGDAVIVLAAAVTGDFSTSGLRLVTAFDRLVVDELPWTDDVPGGEPVLVHDDLALAPPVAAAIRWAELDAGTVWLEPGPAISWPTWTRFTLPEPAPTDRGRYLWLRLSLRGAIASAGDPMADATPAIRAVRLLLPRPSYLRYLPSVYGRRDEDDPTGAVFLERLLALPEHRLTTIEARFEEVARQLNPLAAGEDWLRFVATWFGLVFDPSWPIDRRRRLLVAAHDLFARRGTVDGIRRYLEIYTGHAPAIIEGFQYRVNAAPMTTLGSEVVLGRAALGPAAPPDAPADAGLAHTFAIWVFGDDGACGRDVTEKAARAIVDSIKPAHTTYELHVVDGAPRIGIATTLGVDTVLIGGDRPPPPVGLAPRPPHVLGRVHLPAPPRAASAATLGPIPLDDDLTLT